MYALNKGGYTYIITNKWNTVLYIGVTSDLITRIHRHRVRYYKHSFSSRYNIYKLVYYEFHDSIIEAIDREKYLKRKKRSFKVELIEQVNPRWRDLYHKIEY